ATPGTASQVTETIPPCAVPRTRPGESPGPKPTRLQAASARRAAMKVRRSSSEAAFAKQNAPRPAALPRPCSRWSKGDAEAHRSAAQVPQEAADLRVDLLRLRGGGRPPGADGPHRLVGERDPPQLPRIEAAQRTSHLTRDDLPSLAAFALLQGLAHADDGMQA